jgi:hypothetical protein
LLFQIKVWRFWGIRSFEAVGGALSYDVWWDWQVTAYFVALATPQTTQVVSVVDKVGGIEKLIQQSDIGGSTAVKLDFSLDTPIIIMPRCSDSQE